MKSVGIGIVSVWRDLLCRTLDNINSGDVSRGFVCRNCSLWIDYMSCV